MSLFDEHVSRETFGRDLSLPKTFSDAARAEWWNLLGPSLEEETEAEAAECSQSFAAAFGLESPLVLSAVKAWRFALRVAHERSANESTLLAELSALVGPGAWLEPLLHQGFDLAMRVLSNEATRLTILEHGRVLTSVDWRIEAIARSSRGPIDATIGVITLGCTNGGTSERITFQATADQLVMLRDALAAMLAAPPKA